MHLSRAHLLATSLLATAIMLALVLTHPPRAAAAGTYAITVGSTSTFPGWTSPQRWGSFRASAGRIDTGAGSYPAWSWRRWRLQAPAGVEIAGGRLKGSASTPNSALTTIVREGTNSGAVRRLLTWDGTGAIDLPLASDGDWIDLGLETTAATTLSVSGSNYVTITSLVLTMADPAPPTLDVTDEPDPTTWLGPRECASWSFAGSDSGSGIVGGSITNLTTGTVVESWTYPARPGLAPGSASVSRAACLGASAAVHGTNVLRVRLEDASARVIDGTMRARFDLVAPEISGAPPNAQVLAEPLPTLSIDASDADSGLDSISATFDGVSAAVERDASHVAITPSRPLPIGPHALVITAADAVGNVVLVERTIIVEDHTPPMITVSSPESGGSATPWLAARATDAGSGIDPAGWSVYVDDAPSALTPVGGSISGPLGMLVPGTHTITLSARDGAGNVGTVQRTYTVNAPDIADGTGSSVGGTSGLFVIQAPPPTRQQGRGTVTVLVAIAGRPLANYRVSLHRGATALGETTTDATGVAVIPWIATTPGPATVTVVGADLPDATVHLRVIPRLTIRSSSRTTRPGHATIVRGVLQPHLSRRRIVLMARIGDMWVPVGHPIRVNHRGRFRTSVTAAVRGTISVRASVPASGGWEPATSNTINLQVH